MTQQQYFGQFSGEDYPTFEDWRKSHQAAMKHRNPQMVMDTFAPYIENQAFLDALYPAQLDYVLHRMKFVIELAERRLAQERAGGGES